MASTMLSPSSIEPGASSSSMSGPNALFASIFKSCSAFTYLQEKELFSSADEQINHLMSKDKEFERFDVWSQAKAFPVMATYEMAHSRKCITTAKKFKQFADTYANMVEFQFQDKLFYNLSKAIIWAPFTETDFLADCFLARANAHYRSKDYMPALEDVNRTLNLSPHNWNAIERKVVLLKRLERFAEAYALVKHLAKVSSVQKQFGVELAKMKKDLKRFKPKLKESEVHQEQIEPVHHLEVDSRVEWAMDHLANRLYLRANAFIESGLKVVEEDPVLLVIRPQALHMYCNACGHKCANTCWPCPNCTEVVFCSDECAKLANYHRLECGILGLMDLKDKHFLQGKEARQVYRHLASVGHEQMVELDAQAKQRAHSQVDLHENTLSSAQAQVCFALTSSDLRQFLLTRRPLVSMSNVANAIYFLALYCYKANIVISDRQILAQLIRCLAIEMTKVTCTQYGWRMTDDQIELPVCNYQSLVGCRVGHRCEPNVVWKFNGNRFSLHSIKPINKGDEIGITFGAQAGEPLFKRLTFLSNYYRSCNCDHCLAEASRFFSLRCTRSCNGPIPFDPSQYTQLTCMLCEQPYEHGLAMAVTIEKDFRAMQHAIWLLPEIKDSQEELKVIERKMTALAVALQTRNHQLLSSIEDLCQHYIGRDMCGMAVDWYHWLARIDIYLPPSTDDNDLFGRLHQLDQWAKAYLSHLLLLDPVEQVPKYLEEAKQIFRRMFALMREINHDSNIKTSRLIDSQQYNTTMATIRANVDAKWTQFKALSESIDYDALDQEMQDVLSIGNGRLSQEAEEQISADQESSSMANV